MHELSIARSLVRVAEDAGREAGAHRVTRVYLRLGELSGVVRESLLFAYDFATADTLLAGSELCIEDVPVEVACAACGTVGAPESPTRLRCRSCGERTPDIRAGRELVIRAIDYDDADRAHASHAEDAAPAPSPTETPEDGHTAAAPVPSSDARDPRVDAAPSPSPVRPSRTA